MSNRDNECTLMVIDACAKFGKAMLNKKNSYMPDTKTCQKPCKFEVKGQRCIATVCANKFSSRMRINARYSICMHTPSQL